jgi:hypothetical protein
VGTARKDGTNGAKAVLAYLESGAGGSQKEDALAQLADRAHTFKQPVVRKTDWKRLEEVEADKAAELGLQEFKYPSNEEMLAAIGMQAETA